MVTVAPLTVQRLVVVLVKVTGLPEAPPVAETPKVPPGAKTGLAGVATKPLMEWVD
jgi:hypothetical protein